MPPGSLFLVLAGGAEGPLSHSSLRPRSQQGSLALVWRAYEDEDDDGDDTFNPFHLLPSISYLQALC